MASHVLQQKTITSQNYFCYDRKLKALSKVSIVMTKIDSLNTYQIEVIETMSALIEVVAKDGETALLKAQEKYRSEDMALEPDDVIDTKFIIFDVR